MIFHALPRRGGECRGITRGGGPEGRGFDGGTLLSIPMHTTRASGLAQARIVWEQSAAYMEPPPISLARSLVIGTTGFTLASLAVYGFWAGAGRFMYRTFGEAGFYAVCAALFVVFGAVLLKPLARVSFPRFAMIYGGAFSGYALCWCLGWFLVRGRPGEWLGGFAGSLAFCFVLAAAFGAWRSLGPSTLVLFLGHSAGYFLGGIAYERISVLPQIAWGFFYGLGTGAGIGYAFCQAQRQQSLPSP